MSVQLEKETEDEAQIEPTNVEKIRGLPWSLGMSVAVSIFAQLVFFGSGFVLFLDVLGLNKSQIGFVQSIIPFTGLVAIFAAPAIARRGYKRSFLTFWLLRYIFAAFMLLIPWVTVSVGPQIVPLFLTLIVATFSICRSLALTALMPWQQEYVPDAIRGKYSAMNQILTSIAGFLAVLGSGYVLGISSDVGTFMIIFSIGIAFGLISFWSATRIPGGTPAKDADSQLVLSEAMLSPVRDRHYVYFLIGVGLVTLGIGPLISFVPLFMSEEVGLDPGAVVLLQVGTLFGGVLSSYLWGWAADRYGSRPVMIWGIGLLATLPVFWFLFPLQIGLRLFLAMGIAFLQGIALSGWYIGSSRLLFVNLVPRENRSGYMALYNAWTGIVGGAGLVLGGRVLDYGAVMSGQFQFITFSRYSVLFMGGLVLIIASILFLRVVRAESRVGVGEFAGMFFHGNPVLAMESLIRYQLVRDEHATVITTRKLGLSKSPLAVDELIEALSDPRFNVRFEAIVSIARRGSDEKLIDALVDVLEGSDPALSVIAAWALGRIGNRQAILPLRKGLNAPYRSIQAHCARSLGTLGDAKSVPILLDRLKNETDHGLQVAYASALGKLGVKEATPRLIELLEMNVSDDARMELALALARIVGGESSYIRLMRQMQREPGTAASQAIASIKKEITKLQITHDGLIEQMSECAGALARGNLSKGISLLSQTIRLLPLERMDETCKQILLECAIKLEVHSIERLEYLLLALHTMNVGCIN